MADGGVSLHLGRQQVSPPLIDEQKKKRINMLIHVGVHTHTHTHTHTHKLIHLHNPTIGKETIYTVKLFPL